MNTFADQFDNMLQPLRRFGGFLKVEKDESSGETYRTDIITSSANYSIVAHPVTKDRSRSYIGCIAHVHGGGGNDLADGDFSQVTFNKILADIVSYEMALL